jgi:CheY-like chemotaxis protein
MNSARKRVLCVDDDPDILHIRKLLLESEGYSVITATSGAEALQVVDEGVRVVLLDYLMPGMKGDELARQLRERHPNLPLIAVSAVGQLPQMLVASVDFRVQKGQDPEVLLATIRAAISGPKLEHTVNEPSRTILCVEDDPVQLKMRAMLFESAGYKVLQARSADTAIDAFRSQPVDAVVMDYWLSGENGTAVAEEMKRISRRTPIIMFSGYSSLPGEGAVVDSWLRKSNVQPEELLEEVKRLIDLRSGSAKP